MVNQSALLRSRMALAERVWNAIEEAATPSTGGYKGRGSRRASALAAGALGGALALGGGGGGDAVTSKEKAPVTTMATGDPVKHKGGLVQRAGNSAPNIGKQAAQNVARKLVQSRGSAAGTGAGGVVLTKDGNVVTTKSGSPVFRAANRAR